MIRKIDIFDTTLRDGEQVPGAKLNGEQKLIIAKQLAKINVDVIEAGFPASSPGDFKAVQTIAGEVRGPVITALARAVEKDIEAVGEAVSQAERKRIHIVLGASDIHIKNKFASSRDDIMARGIAAVKFAAKFAEDVQFSTEDATRSDFDYLCRFVEAIIRAGATVVNIPDTVGYAVPGEFGSLVRRLREHVPGTDRIKMSVHCHNDLGLAVSNTVEAVKNGIDQVEVTVNGIGERAGNASLEEVAMILKTREDYYGGRTDLCTRELTVTSRLVSRLMGIPVQVNKPVVGLNAFAHSSGIHQDGILKDRKTYQVISPESVGAGEHAIRLTARSGRHAVRYKLERMGYSFDGAQLDNFHKQFLEMADHKKEVTDADLLNLVSRMNVCDRSPG